MTSQIKFLVTLTLFFLTHTTECMNSQISCSLVRIVNCAKAQSKAIASLEKACLPACNQDTKEDTLTDTLKEAVKEELERREREKDEKKIAPQSSTCYEKIPSWNIAK